MSKLDTKMARNSKDLNHVKVVGWCNYWV